VRFVALETLKIKRLREGWPFINRLIVNANVLQNIHAVAFFSLAEDSPIDVLDFFFRHFFLSINRSTTNPIMEQIANPAERRMTALRYAWKCRIR
jgi:hypothetical protein